jgi:hypothetical protein
MRLPPQVFYKLAPYLWQSAKDKAAELQRHDAQKATNPNDARSEDEEAEPMHPKAQVLTRISLRTMMPNARAVFDKLFKPVEVVEPTYKDIIILYRCGTCHRCDDLGVRAAPAHLSACCCHVIIVCACRSAAHPWRKWPHW